MNICFISPHQFNPTAGGIDRVSVNLIDELQQLGHNVFCVFQQSSVDELSGFGRQFKLPDGSLNSIHNVKYVVNIIEENNIDIILNQSFKNDLDIFCAQLRDRTTVKVITTLHFSPYWQVEGVRDVVETIKYRELNRLKAFLMYCYCYFKQPITRYLRLRLSKQQYQQAYNSSDAYVLLSKHFIPSFKKIIGVGDDSKLFAVSNPIPLNNNGVDIRSKKNQILYVGRVEFGAKRVDRLLQIWKIVQKTLPDWNLVIVGEGEALGTLKKLTKKLKLQRISFEGRQVPSDFYKESKILCVTSSAEGFGMILPEAQSFGCVPIAFDSFESIHDIIEDGVDGILIPPFSIKKYANQLVNICNDDTKREKMAKNGLESMRKFDSKLVAQQWCEIFDKMIQCK